MLTKGETDVLLLRPSLLLLLSSCSPAPSKPSDAGETCNGHQELCDRTIDTVTFPGTHNSMSNADAGWQVPNQQHGLTRQLEDGIRALMLDTMEWNGEPYLCHGYCELGAQPLAEGLREIEDFLVTHPDEVIIIIFQDAISVELTVEVMASVGLSDRAWSWDSTVSPLPTLRVLIEAGKNLVVTGEHGEPPPSWYHHAWDLITDTPYDFWEVEDFDCSRFRGKPESPLFLVNHWVGRPLPTEEGAAEVNTLDSLTARTSSCEATRDRQINILAVDFYNHGDLFSMVDQLNGL